jgi:hypothetical protein
MSLELKEQNLGGMTLNERLFNLNIIEEFDRAVELKDKTMLRNLLKACQLSDERAAATIQQILEPSSTPIYFKKQARKLLLSYLILYPLYYVAAMGVATIALWWLLDWNEKYAITWFKIIALVMGGASYLIHWRIGFYALTDSLKK